MVQRRSKLADSALNVSFTLGLVSIRLIAESLQAFSDWLTSVVCKPQLEPGTVEGGVTPEAIVAL